MGREVQTLPAPAVAQTREHPASQRGWRLLRVLGFWLFALVAGGVLLAGAPNSIQDVGEYHCYALAFWNGAQAAAHLPPGECLAPISSFSPLPFHTLPTEYGPLALLAFLPPLLAPSAWYEGAFFVEMTLVTLAIAWLLDRYGARWSGYVWLIYAVAGGWVLTASRFDVLPSACVVAAIIAARRGKLPVAYLALAAGTLLKLYPLALLPLLLIVSWRERAREPFWRGPLLFAGAVALVEGIAALVTPAAPLTPLTFMGVRCVQIESVAATFAASQAALTHAQPDFPYAFNSTCIATAGVSAAQTATLALGALGVMTAIALFWRRQATLGLAALLLLGSLVVGSKVFSPQYLIWLSPLVALEYGASVAALLGWSLVGGLTTLCFPYSYNGTLGDAVNQSPYIMILLTSGVRNVVLLILGAAVFARRLVAVAARGETPGGLAARPDLVKEGA